MNTPFFSIIMPTYNRAKLLPNTLMSILEQAFTNFELLIIDDGSTDNTKNLLHNFCVQDSRIQYFYKKNEERNIARNYGAERATGEYLIFFDSDDTMDPLFLETYFSHLKDKKTPILSSNIRFENKIIDVCETFKNKNTTLLLCKNGHIYLPCTAFRKDTIEFPFFFPDSKFVRGEDQYRVIKSSTTYPFKIIPYCGINIGQHPERSIYIKNIERQIYSYELMKKILAPILNKRERRALSAEFNLILAFSHLDSDKFKSIIYLLKSLSRDFQRSIDKRTYIFIKEWLYYLFVSPLKSSKNLMKPIN